jgi:SAM-dependent methyltransferase
MSAAACYPLQRDAAEHERLAQQAVFWAADAEALFASAGLAPGMHVADVGCGTHHVPEALARHVGERGRVHALDNDAHLLATLSARPLPPAVTPVHGDAYALPWADGALDAVHARFVAAPCGRVDLLLDEMLRVLRPGGVLMLQEPDGEHWHVDADGDAWPRLRALIRDGFRRRGGDFDAGRTLAQRLAGRVTGLRQREVAHETPARHPYAALPLAFAESLAASWRAHRLVDDVELAALRGALARSLSTAGARVRTFTLVQVWGRKAVASS